jgi:peroxiredoxin family protein
MDTALQQVLSPAEPSDKPKRLALVCSKGGLDEVYPILIMASTAGALGWEAGVFCTFYGLDLVNPKRRKKMKVSAVGNAASPPPINGLEFRVPTIMGILPGMNWVAGRMMKSWMKKAQIPDVEEMMQTCLDSGVQFYACATTMGVMGVTKDDVMPEASCLGATAFLDFAAGADIAMFI